MYSLTQLNSKVRFAIVFAVGIAIALFGFAVMTANAHTEPGGCTTNGLGISLGIFRSDEVTPIAGGDTVAVGEVIKYQTILSALGGTNCNFEGGTLTITTPDGVTDVTPGGGIPLVSVGNPFASSFVSYTVDGAEIGGDGDIDSSTSYVGGQSHTGTIHDTASGSVTKQTLVSGTVIVVKDTVPNDGTDFTFTSGSLPGAPFNLDDDADVTLQNSQTFSGLTPGTFDVAETANPNYSTVASCSDDSPIGAISLQAGETVTCTFTNTLQQGHIVVDKVTDPAGDPQSFSFDASGGTYGDFSLTDAAAPNDQALLPGAYSVTETVPAGWDLESAVCVSSIADNETAASLELDNGETITCTFTNEKDANIIVTKQTNPDGNAQIFNFTASYDGDGFALSDGQSNDSGDLDPGTYSVAETPIAGWDLETATCTDGTPASISLQAGETVTCTFTNTLEQGHIIVNKVTDPSGDPQSFSFDATGTGYSDFALTDAAAPNDQTLAAGAYSVSETLPAGWVQTSATCVSSIQDTETIASLELDAGETITCTFTNTKNGHLIVEKETNPAADPTVFSITASGNGTITGGGSGTITDATDKNYEVTPGTYSVSETAVLGWNETSNTCAGVVVAAGATVTCKIVNTKVAVQGCSPGYWKQSQHFGSYPAGIYPNTLFSTVFGGTAFPGMSLLQVLNQGGGGINALGRIMVGAYLNASTVTGFAYTPAQVIAAFNGATPATYDSVKAQFEALQDPCPFGNNPGPAGPGLPIADKPGKPKNQ